MHVFVRSNRNEPMISGVLVGSTDRGMPIVSEDHTDLEFVCMGIVLPFEGNSELLSLLEPMTPKEQWDYLSERVLSGKLKRLSGKEVTEKPEV